MNISDRGHGSQSSCEWSSLLIQIYIYIYIFYVFILVYSSFALAAMFACPLRCVGSTDRNGSGAGVACLATANQ